MARPPISVFPRLVVLVGNAGFGSTDKNRGSGTADLEESLFLRAEQDKSLVWSIITMFVLPVPVMFIDLLTDFQIKNTSISIHPDPTEL
jgi:hypothetical protein